MDFAGLLAVPAPDKKEDDGNQRTDQHWDADGQKGPVQHINADYDTYVAGKLKRPRGYFPGPIFPGALHRLWIAQYTDGEKDVADRTYEGGVGYNLCDAQTCGHRQNADKEEDYHVLPLYLSNSGQDANPLEGRGCDVLITPLPVNYEYVCVKEYYRERLYIIVPRGHRFCEQREVDLR